MVLNFAAENKNAHTILIYCLNYRICGCCFQKHTAVIFRKTQLMAVLETWYY